MLVFGADLCNVLKRPLTEEYRGPDLTLRENISSLKKTFDCIQHHPSLDANKGQILFVCKLNERKCMKKSKKSLS